MIAVVVGRGAAACSAGLGSPAVDGGNADLTTSQIGEKEKIRNVLQDLAALDDLTGDDEFRFEDTEEGWRLHSVA